jgi:hypothetical protein
METPDKFPLPAHVLHPGSTTDFVAVAVHEFTNRAGLGYAILRALGTHERLSPIALATIAKWSAEYGAAHGGVTPDPMNLVGQDFVDRVGTKWSADKAARNASCYPGGREGRPSYASVFREVWVERRWPKLCDALADGLPREKSIDIEESVGMSDSAAVERQASAPPARWAMRTAGSGLPAAAADQDVGDVVSSVRGRAPQNEQGSLQAARMVVSKLCTLGFSWHDVTDRTGLARHGRRARDYENAIRVHEADALGIGDGATPPLPMQVVRAVVREAHWKELGQRGATTPRNESIDDLVAGLLASIEHKKFHVGHGVVLVLDSSASPQFFAPGVVDGFRRRHGAQVRTLRWEAIWLSAVTPDSCARLDVESQAQERGPILGIGAGPARSG